MNIRILGFTFVDVLRQTDSLNTKGKLGFTLAEVLITLGIIGIVAAMTIPTLIKTYQKTSTAQQLKETYSIITQAAKLYTNETETEFGSFDTQISEKEFLDKYFSPYLKVVLRCEPASECYKNAKTPLAIDRKTTLTLPAYMIGLLNGSYVGVMRTLGGAVFYVDLNGRSNPNVEGRDIFSFYLVNIDTIGNPNSGCKQELAALKNFKSGLYPGGFENCYIPHAAKTREQLLGTAVHRSCNPKTSWIGQGGGNACAAVIMMDGWKISKDYPW